MITTPGSVFARGSQASMLKMRSLLIHLILVKKKHQQVVNNNYALVMFELTDLVKQILKIIEAV